MAVKRYNGTSWDTVAGLGAQGAAATSSSITTWVKTATGGETSLTGSSDSSTTLAYTPGQEQLFINGVLQVRGSDYTATNGTSITGLTALVAGDIATVTTVNAFSVTGAVPLSTVTANGDLIVGTSSGAVGRLGIGSTDQVLKVSGGVPTWATPTSSSGPAFRATRATTQSISANTTTKMEFNSETFDTDGCYDPTTNFRFTPTTAGYYQVGAMAYFYAASFGYGRIYIYKNGSNALETEQPPRTSGSASPAFTHLIAMNGSTDYLEVYVRMDAAGTVGDGIVANNFYAFWTRSL